MEFIKEWIITITVVIVFTMLMDILIPSSSMKKFAKVIMGLLIILVIVKPFLMLKGMEQQFKSTMVEAAAYIEDPESLENQSMEAFQSNAALNIYRQKLTEEIAAVVRKQEEFKNKQIDVNAVIDNDLNSSSFGTVKTLEISIHGKEDRLIQAASIQPVKINTETVINKKQDEYKWNNSEISLDLEKTLRDELGLLDTVIKIEIQE